MITDITVPAPAKINLHLAVGGRRPDGFHAIASLFQAVSLSDSVALSRRPGDSIELAGACGCPEEHNTAYRAAAAFFSAANAVGQGLESGLRIDIAKRIPLGAGLGGGSSDAASTLAGLATMFPGAVDASSLRRIAAGIGSDVPFFLETACAAVTGRGERLSPVAPRLDYALLIVDPGFSVSTKEAYDALDASRGAALSPPCRAEEELAAELGRVEAEYASVEPARWTFRNDFFELLSKELPRLASCRDAIARSGASFAAMSGSGSAIFGVFDDETSAKRAHAELSAEYMVRIAFPLARLRDSI